MPAPKAKQSFEELYQALEEKVTLLEHGGLSLDDSLAAYEDAVAYAQRCQQLLDRAELRITRLRASTLGGGDGAADGADQPEDEEPFEPPDEAPEEDEA